jgi:hypothetical protein
MELGCEPLGIIRVITLVLRIQPMPKTVWATFSQGKVELSEPITVPDGTRILVTILPDDENDFWLKASQTSLAAVWDNDEDDIYAKIH